MTEVAQMDSTEAAEQIKNYKSSYNNGRKNIMKMMRQLLKILSMTKFISIYKSLRQPSQD